MKKPLKSVMNQVLHNARVQAHDQVRNRASISIRSEAHDKVLIEVGIIISRDFRI